MQVRSEISELGERVKGLEGERVQMDAAVSELQQQARAELPHVKLEQQATRRRRNIPYNNNNRLTGSTRQQQQRISSVPRVKDAP